MAAKKADKKAEAQATEGEGAAAAGKGGKKKLVLLAVPMVLLAAGAGLWFTGVLPGLLGLNPPPKTAAAGPAKPVFVAMPEIIANLDAGPRRASYIKLQAEIEVASAADATKLTAAMPKVMDLFQTYLRDMHPSELQGSEGTYRLREELINRANIAAAPARVVDVLFQQILVQ
ncbi:MAG: flagellar basal body-associated FliL family protein [Acetobacteraceae bacterium]